MTLDTTFAALSDPARRDLVRRLARGSQTAGMLAAPYAVSRPAISRHLRVLREAGLVRVRTVGRERWYALEPAGLDEARRWVEEIEDLWTDALEALKSYIEADHEQDAGDPKADHNQGRSQSRL